MQHDQLTTGASVRVILPNAAVTVVTVQWHGSDALMLTYRDPAGRVAEEILYRHYEARIDLVEAGRPWSSDCTPLSSEHRTYTVPDNPSPLAREVQGA